MPILTLNARISTRLRLVILASLELLQYLMDPFLSAAECIAGQPKCCPFLRMAHPAIGKNPKIKHKILAKMYE